MSGLSSRLGTKHFPYAAIAVTATSSLYGWTSSSSSSSETDEATASEKNYRNTTALTSSSSQTMQDARETSSTVDNNTHNATNNSNKYRFPRMNIDLISSTLSIIQPSTAATTTTLATSSSRCLCEEQEQERTNPDDPIKSNLRKRRTIERLSQLKTEGTVHDKYNWNTKAEPIGRGAYSEVYKATTKDTDEVVALKKISKKYTDSRNFLQEMEAMMHIQDQGGHPHLISLHEHFETDDSFILVLDFIQGGELFDHLIDMGAYSEMDASRLVREVASGLNFLHGIGIVHADLKPENILMSTTRRGDSVVKLADFGTAVFVKSPARNDSTSTDNNKSDKDEQGRFLSRKYEPVYGAPTPAYSPAESIERTITNTTLGRYVGVGCDFIHHVDRMSPVRYRWQRNR